MLFSSLPWAIHVWKEWTIHIWKELGIHFLKKELGHTDADRQFLSHLQRWLNDDLIDAGQENTFRKCYVFG